MLLSELRIHPRIYLPDDYFHDPDPKEAVQHENVTEEGSNVRTFNDTATTNLTTESVT